MSTSILTLLMIITVTTTTTTMMTMMPVVESYEAREMHRAPRFIAEITRHFRRSKVSRETRGYVEQCRATNLGKEHLGHVNVFAFLDPSWYYSYRQAIMLELLKKRLEKSGFSNILFFVIAPPSNMPEDIAENEVEIKAWREISKNMLGSEHFLDTKQIMFDEHARNKRGIIFVQDTPELGIWESFHASKDEVVIVDRCGKLTYQVIVPWSILYFPYVKAAILSTYNEDPCGPCDEESSTVHYSMDYEEFLLNGADTGGTTVDGSFDSATENTFSDSKTVTMSLEELNGTANEYNTPTSNSFDVNTYESTTYDVTTIDMSSVQTGTSESVTKDGSTVLTDTNFEMTSETTTEYVQNSNTLEILVTTENYEQVDRTDKNTSLTINNSVASLGSNRERLPPEPATSLEKVETDEGHKTVHEDAGKKEFQQDESLPLRIILYAPHLHEESGMLKKYTHLVLKTGSPEYHGHFHSKATSNQEPTVLKKSDSPMLDDQKLTEYIRGKSESPGVYGEIADYWRTTEEEETNNKDENTEFINYDYATAEDTNSNINNAFDSDSSILRPSDIDTIESDTNTKTDDEIDEFMQQRLIDHYSKLLTWIYYIL